MYVRKITHFAGLILAFGLQLSVQNAPIPPAPSPPPVPSSRTAAQSAPPAPIEADHGDGVATKQTAEPSDIPLSSESWETDHNPFDRINRDFGTGSNVSAFIDPTGDSMRG
jgi:hypothetical protein